jgi:uncharacterized membrane protein YraQ (UPF0718 family)/YHS domain-containing protein
MFGVLRAVSLIFQSLKESGLMFFATFWALVLGFSLSGVIQSFFRKKEIEKKLGSGSAVCTLRASIFGFASSSCSYAASAMSKSIFQKGADFVSANVFMFASTNLVIELGIVMAILMGWQFLLAEFIGGAILIILFSIVGKIFFPKSQQAKIMEHLDKATNTKEDMLSDITEVDMLQTADRTFITKIKDAASYSLSDIRMLKYELLIGFLVAGLIAKAVPVSFWRSLFISNHGVYTDIENAAIGPIIATLSFVCSVGNIPLAAALYKDGISFSGVMSFVFADLITFPLLLIYRKFYGVSSAIKMYVSFYLVMAVTGELTKLIFAGLHLVPSNSSITINKTDFGFNYNFYLDLIFIVIFIATIILYLSSLKSKDSSKFAIDPICKMQVDKENAAATSIYLKKGYYFCSGKCKEQFDKNPERYAKGDSKSEIVAESQNKVSVTLSKKPH